MTGQGSNEGRKGTRVTFLDQTGAKSVDAVIADTVTVKRILPNIITKMNLPVMGPDGQPMSYSLDHKEGGRRLREDQTLVDAQVGDGDHLIVYPEIVAGYCLRFWGEMREHGLVIGYNPGDTCDASWDL